MSFIKTNINPKPVHTDEAALTSSQVFGERKVKSRFWYSIEAYSDMSFSSLANLLHLSSFFAGLEICLFMVWQIKANASSYYITFGLPTIGHRYLYGDMLPSFSWFQSDYAVCQAVFFVFLSLQITLILFSIYLLRRVKSEPIRKSDWTKSISWLLSQLLLLKNSVALGPVAELASIVIRKDPEPWIQVVAVFFLLLIPVEIILNCALTYDYGFITTNLFQGRSYRFFIGRAMGLVLTMFLKTMWEGTRTRSSDLLVNTISVIVSFTLAYIQVLDNTYYWSPTLEKLSTFTLAFYCWESFDILFIRLFPDFAVKLDHDYITVTIVPLIYWCERNLLTVHRKKVGNLGSHLGHKSANDGVFYLELLYGAFRNFKVEENAFMVGSSLSRHTATCKDPLCLCFFLRANVDLRCGYPAGSSARDLADRTLGIDRRNANDSKEGSVESTGFGKLCTINLHDIIAEYKLNHQKVASIEVSPDRTSLKMTQVEFDAESDKMNYVLNLQDPPSYLAAILGFFRSLIHDHSKANNFDAVFGFLRFAIGEYGSCLSALLVLYDYVYSVEYSRQVTLVSDFLMLNLKQQARRKLAEEDSEDRKSLENKTITQILAMRKRIQTLSKATMDAIVSKRDLYDYLALQLGESDKAYQAGRKQHLAQTQLEAEYAELISNRTPNIELMKSAIHFEMFVLEKKAAPRSLLKRFKELSQDYLQRTTYDPVDGIPVLRHASPYAGDHAVVLTKYTNNSYRISHMTDNAAELFGAEARDLQGRKLTDFMPKEFAEKHDMIVNTFLNGQSRSKFNAEIPVVMLSEGGLIKSVTIIPRVEAVFTEEIYIGAMMQKRNQLALSTTVTSLGGRVQKIGRPCSQFKWTLQEGDSVFRVVPGLFHALYPNSRTSFSSRMRRAEERVHDATTLRPPDFEKSMIDPSTRSFGGETEMLAATKTIRVGQTQRGETIPVEDAFVSQSALFNPQTPDVQPGQTVTTLTEVFMYCFYDGVPSTAAIEEWRKTDALYSAVAQQIPGWKTSGLRGQQRFFGQLAESDLEHACRSFQHDRDIFAKNLEFAQRVCLKIDTHYYSPEMALREISVLKSERSGAKHFLFFQTLANKAPRMIGILSSISPDTVEELNRYWLQVKKSKTIEPNQASGPNSPLPQVLKMDSLVSGNSPVKKAGEFGRGASLKLKTGASSGSNRSLNFKIHPRIAADSDPATSGQSQPKTSVFSLEQQSKSKLIRQQSAGQVLANKNGFIAERTDDDEDSKDEAQIPKASQELTSSEPQDVFGEKKPGPQKLLLKTRTDGTAAKTDLTPLSQSAAVASPSQPRDEMCDEINKLSEVDIPRELIDYLAIMVDQFKSSDDKVMAKMNLYVQELDMNADKAGSSAIERQEIRMDVRMRAGKEIDANDDEGNKTVKYSRDTEQRTEKQLEELRKLEEMDIQVTSNMISTVRSKPTQNLELQHIRKLMRTNLETFLIPRVLLLLYLAGVIVIGVSLGFNIILNNHVLTKENRRCDAVSFVGVMLIPSTKMFKRTSKSVLNFAMVDSGMVPANTQAFPETFSQNLRSLGSEMLDKVESSRIFEEGRIFHINVNVLPDSPSMALIGWLSSTIPSQMRSQNQTFGDLKYHEMLIKTLSTAKWASARNTSTNPRTTDSSQQRSYQMEVANLQLLTYLLSGMLEYYNNRLRLSLTGEVSSLFWVHIAASSSMCFILCMITLTGVYVIIGRVAHIQEAIQHIDLVKCEDARVRLLNVIKYLQNVHTEKGDLEEQLDRFELFRTQKLFQQTKDNFTKLIENGEKIRSECNQQKNNRGMFRSYGTQNDPRKEQVLSIAPSESQKLSRYAGISLGRDGSQKNLQIPMVITAPKNKKRHVKQNKKKKSHRVVWARSVRQSSVLYRWRSASFGFAWLLAFIPLLIGLRIFHEQINTMEQKLWAASVLYTDVGFLEKTIGFQYNSLRETVLSRIGSNLTSPALRQELDDLVIKNIDRMGSDLIEYFNGELTFLNQAVRSKVICDSPVYSDAERATCTSIISNYRETLFEGTQQYLSLAKLRFVGHLSTDDSQVLRMHRYAQDIDEASHYFGTAITVVAEELVASARKDLNSSITLLSSLGYVFVLLVALVLLLHRCYWTPKATEKFRMIFSTLLVLNDDILINPYLMHFLIVSSNSHLMR